MREVNTHKNSQLQMMEKRQKGLNESKIVYLLLEILGLIQHKRRMTAVSELLNICMCEMLFISVQICIRKPSKSCVFVGLFWFFDIICRIVL